MLDLSPRGRVMRDALIYTPLFLVCVAGILLMVGSGDPPWIGVFLVGVMAFLFGYQSIQSLRDLSSAPLTVEGPITRRWTKRDAFVSKSHYITVERGIYRIGVEDHLDLLEKDSVRVVAYPHTGTVVSVERLARPDDEPKPAAAMAKGRLRMLRTARSTPSARRGETVDTPPSPDKGRRH